MGWSGNIGKSKHWQERGISFSSIGFDRSKKMGKISMVSDPVVIAVESNSIWFVKLSG